MDKKKEELLKHIRFKEPIVVSEADQKASFAAIRERIAAGEKVAVPVVKPVRKMLPFYYGAAAAVVAVLLTIGGLGIYNNQTVAIANNSNAIKELILPDGSELSLGMNSQIRYKRNFKRNRNLKLEGQAYLDVIRDEARPFTVNTRLASIRVLGTQFSVRDFAGEQDCKTVLFEGSVAITNEASEVVLKPGFEAVVNTATGAIEVAAVTNPDRALAWKTRQLYFEDESVSDILNAIAEVYQLKLVLKTDEGFDQKYTVTFNHGETVGTMLDVVSDIASLHYTINDNQLIVSHR